MGRITKPRTVCMEHHLKFIPETRKDITSVKVTIEECETIRLIDYEGLSQKECAVMMEVSRSTIQSIYDSARYKISDALINRKPIIVKGGHYQLCNHDKSVEHCAKNKRYNEHES